MKYFYLHPFKPQYFFPKAFKKHKVFISFFKPYTLVGKISWYLFRNIYLYRIWFGKTNIEDFIPEKAIRKFVGLETLMAFNTGTPGPQQKVTALGWHKNIYFFIKYAQTPSVIKNVVNEYNILCQLSGLKFVPKVQEFHQDEQQVLLKTDVLIGSRLDNVSLSEKILNCLFTLSEVSNISENKSTPSVKTAFAHGDFCPWNIMDNNGEILLYDWEMGGNYPLGYDLFTYIFQTNFLLKPNKSIQNIINENKNRIEQYFTHFNILEWNNYLINFSKIKVNLEREKGLKGMLFSYQILLDYAKKN